MSFVKILIASSLLFLGVFFVASQPALAQTKNDICEGVALTGGSCTEPASGPTVQSTIALVINILSIVVGVIAVIMIIIGGLRYITSGGDSNNTKGAKDTILYAIIGLVVVALAQGIVRFVLSRIN